jgi:hypothetical protein
MLAKLRGDGGPWLPYTLGRGRPSANASYDRKHRIRRFAAMLKQIDSTHDFKLGPRGWCYIIEEHGLTKAQFPIAEQWITFCRKQGLLPIDFTAEDDNRSWGNLEDLDDRDHADHVQGYVDALLECWKEYTPISFWDFQSVFIMLAVEKIDLYNLFLPICREFHVPIANTKGWSDLHLRANAVKLFKKHEKQGRKIVLLYCGDFDPVGVNISRTLKKNFRDIRRAVGWSPDNLKIDRFGLNKDFIDRHRLSWSDNLITSSGDDLADPRHKWHCSELVQTWLRTVGKRKVEANALVARPDAGRQLCRAAILKYLSLQGIKRYEAELTKRRKECRAAIPRIK